VETGVYCAVQLTPARPRRPDTESRPVPSVDQKTPEPTTTTTVRKSPVPVAPPPVADSNSETPPPLPEKSLTLGEPHNDYANVGICTDSTSDRQAPPVMRRCTHRDRVCTILRCCRK